MKHFFVALVCTLLTCFSSFAFSGKGGGTEKDPYQITNADEFFEIRNELDAHYKLMNDIDLAEFIKEDNPTQGWSPIGNATTPFTGSLDGNNKSVKGLYINRPSSENVGLFGCVSLHNIHDFAILNASIVGKSNVGTLAGLFAMDYNESKTSMECSNIIILNTHVNGDQNVGGIIGSMSILNKELQWSMTREHESIVKGCFITGVISSENKAGGVCGFANSGEYHWYMDKWTAGGQQSHKLVIKDNFMGANVTSKGIAGGIVALLDASREYNGQNRTEWWVHNFDITRNVVKGTISGSGKTCGICQIRNSVDDYGNETWVNMSLHDNLFAADSLCSVDSKELYRIANIGFPNNYAYSGSMALGNNTEINLEDNDYNGVSYGLKTLKKRATYEGMGFDFGKQWAIKEGETFPYNINQSEMPEITEFISGSRAYISGKAYGTGQVYVFVGGNLFESFVVDNQWKVELGNIPEGTEAKVSVALNGKMPSVQIEAVAVKGSSDPEVKSGDADGDGVIDAADVVSIINYIIGKGSSSFNALNADINGDDQVLVDDAVGTVELIMNAQ